MQALGQVPRWWGRRDFRVSQEVTRQSRPQTGGTAGGFRCQPGLDPAVGPTLPVSDRGSSQRPGDPWGRALGSEPTVLAWNPSLYPFPIPLPSWAVRQPTSTLGTMFADLDYDIEEDKLGIPTVPGKVTLQKDAQNLIGISIGGGAQYCPCLYIVQVFDNTPAALDGTVAAGDEITGVNGRSIKGKTKVEVAKMIQEVKGEVTIHYNKLQADPKQGMSLDIVLKKVKHRLVENMSSGTADALGLSRAILCNDGLVKRLEELERTAELYKGMTEHTKNLLRAFYELSQTHRAFGDVFSVIGVREP
ncbi:unnamed protein product, partial [Gulo gulo]